MAKQFIKYRKRTRTDGIWEIVWNDPETGNVCRESCKTRDEHAAERKLAEKILTGDVVPPSVVTIGYLLERYFQHLKRRKAENTIVPMESKVERLMDYMGNLKWDEFGQSDVENYIDHARSLTRWDRGGKPLSDGTIKKDLQILRSALRHGHLHRLVPTETRIEIRNLVSAQRTDWLDETQMKAVLQCCAEDEDRNHIYGFLLLALATGARKEAIFQLTRDQVYIPPIKTELVEVAPTRVERDGVVAMPKRTYRNVATKNKPLNWETGEVVQGAYIDFGAAQGNKRRPQISIGQNERLMHYLLFCVDRSQPYVVSYRGQPIRTGIKKGLEAVGNEAGLPFKLTHHVLKRTCITWMVRKGISFDAIERMTNTTVDTLKRHYSQHSPDLEEVLGDTFSI
ncbi:tyrosine-type recombinase/integrase [Falsiruegeria mediterranea]|uniref:tyrosine-type recombinase/integrase n=1 Tax=Falsiruegeria mediterranea TaxID=1280832 RepID=UPI0015F27CC5|nr:tyrosine-type recombinase/integrase [Falsiruegeria mediterranea]